MRIRRRQPPSNSTLPLLAVNVPLVNPEVELLVGQTTCTCCSREKQLYWELNKEVEEDEAPSNRFVVEESVTNDSKGSVSEARAAECEREETLFSRTARLGASYRKAVGDSHFSEIETEDKDFESQASPTLDNLRNCRRGSGNQDILKSTGGQAGTYSSGQIPISEGDVNHPGNKPKESLLYSLYCVFSKLSGKPVLTAREALSRIIEQRLPGLDEETGLPSVQVAKVMRSNPYFVHLEGGKFFLCSCPSSESRNEESSGAMISESPPRPVCPSLEQRITPLNGSSKPESSREQQQPLNRNGGRNKRARSKGAVADDGTSGKPDRITRPAKTGGGVKASLPLTKNHKNTLKEADGSDPDVDVPICKRYDGRGWKCNEKALEGYSMCRHHHELIVNRLARLRNSGRLGLKAPVKRRKNSGKQLKEGSKATAPVNEGELTINSEQNGSQWWKNVKARSLKSINLK